MANLPRPNTKWVFQRWDCKRWLRNHGVTSSTEMTYYVNSVRSLLQADSMDEYTVTITARFAITVKKLNKQRNTPTTVHLLHLNYIGLLKHTLPVICIPRQQRQVSGTTGVNNLLSRFIHTFARSFAVCFSQFIHRYFRTFANYTFPWLVLAYEKISWLNHNLHVSNWIVRLIT